MSIFNRKQKIPLKSGILYEILADQRTRSESSLESIRKFPPTKNLVCFACKFEVNGIICVTFLEQGVLFAHESLALRAVMIDIISMMIFDLVA